MRQALARWLKRWCLTIGVVTALIYFAMIPMTVLVFPATTLLLTIVVLFGGFTGSLFAIASFLASAETDDRLDSLESYRPATRRQA